LPNFLFFLPEEIESKFTQFDGKSFSPFSIFFWIFPFFLSSFESYRAKGKAYINSLLLSFSLLFFWKNEPKKWQKGWEVKKFSLYSPPVTQSRLPNRRKKYF